MRPLPGAFALLARPAPDGAQSPGPALGIALLCAAVLCFTLMDATAKHLTQTYPPVQVIWARFAVNLVIVLALWRGRVPVLLRSRRPALQLLRALTQLASVGLFFTALQFIGLAEATAIMDVNPVLITLGAALFLGERIGPRRAFGIAAALAGALIIIRPGLGVFQPAALLPMIGAATYAAGALLTRVLRADGVATSVLWSALTGSVLTSLAVPFVWQPVAASDLWAFVLVGLFGTVSQALLIRAFALAEAALLAPFGYAGLVWAGLWGWLFFGQIPDRWTICGAAIIVAAGLYVWSRETRTPRKDR